ncbi:imm11 family protein [Corallococcus llansteffanensis]
MPAPGRLTVPVVSAGKALDFSRAGLCIPVVHVKVATVFAELAPEEVQLFPVDLPQQPEQFCILVATRLIRCIDDNASKAIERWLPEDGQPEKVGEYRNVRGMRIDAAKVGDVRVFRPWGWNVALIISEEIRDALVLAGATGAKFKQV